MSLVLPDFTESVIVRSADAEVVGRAPTTVRLLADSSATGGALSTQRVTLLDGADGAEPHHHAGSAELFYLIDGTAQLLSGEQVVTAERGDLVVVPPGLAHAFAAAPGHDADILIVITPGVERFAYFRHLERVAYGRQPPQSLLDVQELYDTYFRGSEVWDRARPAPGGAAR
ncbi:cupin domain-containing protein [Actinacidiphila yeochonensis]|uniref:cupin domain-containing protein n=1 Tax=Actinacidiphila yeochonensis TaxID=89050 RepID=UPI0005623555|nr:cupin domain-containing protein [Actinacidiphila yeochonensis]